MKTIVSIIFKRTFLNRLLERIGLLKPLTAEITVQTKSLANLKDIKLIFSDWEKFSHIIKLVDIPTYQETKGLTRKELFDCYVRAFLSSSVTQEYLDNFSSCWTFVEGEDPKPTQFLLDKLAANDPCYLSAKQELNAHSSADLYLVKFQPDPQAVFQNFIREIEKAKGMLPDSVICDNQELPKVNEG